MRTHLRRQAKEDCRRGVIEDLLPAARLLQDPRLARVNAANIFADKPAATGKGTLRSLTALTLEPWKDSVGLQMCLVIILLPTSFPVTRNSSRWVSLIPLTSE